MKHFLKSFYIILLDAVIIAFFIILIECLKVNNGEGPQPQYLLYAPCIALTLFNTLYLVEQTIEKEE